MAVVQILYWALLLLFPKTGEGTSYAVDPVINSADTINYVIYDSFEEMEKQLFHSSGDKVKVINFWATWCGPCVKELPFFEELNKDKNIEVVLVSLDFKNQLQRRLDPFLQKHQLKAKVVVLGDEDSNKWIDMVDPSWSGAIPATLFIKGKKKIFAEQEFDSKSEILTFINSLN